jgi:hypothetical protein
MGGFPFCVKRPRMNIFFFCLLTWRLGRIILLIWGSFIPSIYYGFAEDMEWVRVYWSMVSLDFIFEKRICAESLATKKWCNQ